jgi:hypothetical protein
MSLRDKYEGLVIKWLLDYTPDYVDGEKIYRLRTAREKVVLLGVMAACFVLGMVLSRRVRRSRYSKQSALKNDILW